MSETLLVGAVAYEPKVVSIWNGFQEYFAGHGLNIDYVLYSNYERQVEQHFSGAFHVAWNSPLAWLQADHTAKRLDRSVRVIAMRDTDRDLRSVIVARSDSGIETLQDLAGKRVGFGAYDSPQATLIPLLHIEKAGLERGKDFEEEIFDVLVGKHGDHIGGERDAAKALCEGRVDAACMLDANYLCFEKEGMLSAGAMTVLSETDTFDHCNFTVLEDAPHDLVDRFRELLLEMCYDDPMVRPLLDLEGLKAWREGRTSGYTQLTEAVARFGTIADFVGKLAKRLRG